MKTTDDLGEPDFKQLDRDALEQALAALRERPSFHTHDLATHSILRATHRMAAFDPGFRELVEAWLARNGVGVGVRGPLPGHPAWGSRWAFFEGDAALRPDVALGAKRKEDA
ncbi:MAG: hypothetical protein CSA66_07760 [Proteobacteria bacterium]|nr:MAG: hypothetical protein CSA66_07760 [Pseudomonadota bacterium]